MASSILNSDDGVISGTSGLKSTGGDDGVLVFQSKGTETAQINTDKQIVAAAGTASLPVLTTTGDVNTGIYFPAADNIGFATGGTIRGRWTTDGLCFGSDTAAANALDDYEEGEWTPIYTTDGTAMTVTYAGARSGNYTKIGNLVICRGALRTNSVSGGSGNVLIGGLPFTVNNNTITEQGFSGGFVYSASGFTGDHPLNAQTEGNTTHAYVLYRTAVNGGTSLLQVADLGGGSLENFAKFMIIYTV